MKTKLTIPAIMGAVLIICGILQIFFQMAVIAYEEHILGEWPSFAKHSTELADFASWSFRTSYPGLIMIGAGTLLLLLSSSRRSN